MAYLGGPAPEMAAIGLTILVWWIVSQLLSSFGWLSSNVLGVAAGIGVSFVAWHYYLVRFTPGGADRGSRK